MRGPLLAREGCPASLQSRGLAPHSPWTPHVGQGLWGGDGVLAAGSAAAGGLSLEQKLSGSHKALVEMQDIVAELLKTVPREHPATKVRRGRVGPTPTGSDTRWASPFPPFP